MAKDKKKEAYERMFGSENQYAQIPIVYPVIVKHKSGAVEKFYENGVTEYIGNNSQGGTCFSRTKQTKPRDEYEFFIRRLMYVSWGVGSQEDWDAKIIEVDEMHEKLTKCKLDEYFNGVKLDQNEQPGQIQQVENTDNREGEARQTGSGITCYSGEDPF